MQRPSREQLDRVRAATLERMGLTMDQVLKYRPDQTRDQRGRFSDEGKGGGSGGASTSASTRKPPRATSVPTKPRKPTVQTKPISGTKPKRPVKPYDQLGRRQQQRREREMERDWPRGGDSFDTNVDHDWRDLQPEKPVTTSVPSVSRTGDSDDRPQPWGTPREPNATPAGLMQRDRAKLDRMYAQFDQLETDIEDAWPKELEQAEAAAERASAKWRAWSEKFSGYNARTEYSAHGESLAGAANDADQHVARVQAKIAAGNARLKFLRTKITDFERQLGKRQALAKASTFPRFNEAVALAKATLPDDRNLLRPTHSKAQQVRAYQLVRKEALRLPPPR